MLFLQCIKSYHRNKLLFLCLDKLYFFHLIEYCIFIPRKTNISGGNVLELSCLSVHQCVCVSICVQNNSFCQSTGTVLNQSHSVTALVCYMLCMQICIIFELHNFLMHWPHLDLHDKNVARRHLSKLKAYADDNCYNAQLMQFIFNRVKTLREKEKMFTSIFSLF